MLTDVGALSSVTKTWWHDRVLCRYDAQYTWVALGFDDGTVIILSVEEVNVGKWFEVFPLKVASALPDYLSHHVFAWITLPQPVHIDRVRSLWRAEWLEPAHQGSQCLGADPHTVYVSSLQDAPADARAFGVEAGIELRAVDRRLVVICSSDSAPFKIDFAMIGAEIEKIQRLHTAR